MAHFVQHLYRLGDGPVDSFRADLPLSTHWEPATCAEADCPHFLGGWKTELDESIPAHKDAADWVRSLRGRMSFEERHDVEGLTVFIFAPGQTCFRRHHLVQSGRPALYSHDGRPHVRPEDWYEDLRETAEPAAKRMAEELERAANS